MWDTSTAVRNKRNLTIRFLETMYGLLNDYMLFLKLFLFFFLLRWLMDHLGHSKTLFVLGLLLGGYYIFFARWTILGALMVILFLFVMGGVGTFMQDMIFQYDSLRATEAEAHQPMTPIEMLRRY